MRILTYLILTLALVASGMAQTSSGIARKIQWGAAMPATCTPNTGDIFFVISGGTGTPYYCSTVNSWLPMAGSATPGNAASVVTTTFSATPTFTCPSSSAGTVTDFVLSTALTANITSSILASCRTGQIISFRFVQDGTGGRTVAWPTGFSQACIVSPIANVGTNVSFWWDGSTAQIMSCVADSGPTLYTSEQAAPGTPPAGQVYCWPDSTNHAGLECKANGSANVFKMLGPLTGVLLGNGASAVGVVAGTATDCVKVNGTSGTCGGSGGTAGAPLFVQNQSVTVTNTGTETSLDGTVASGGSKTIPANWFSAAGAVMDVCFGGYLSADAAVPGTLRLKVKFGSTVLADTGATTLPAAITANTNFSGCLSITARTVGASGTLIANNAVGFSQALAGLGLGFLATSAVTIDTTATQALTFTVQWGTADTDNTITMTNLWAASPGSSVSSVVGATGAVTSDAIEAAMSCADAGSTDAYACSLSPAITAYVTGRHYRIKANTANTGAATVTLNAIGAKTIVKAAGGITTALADNDIRAGQWIDLVYDGTNMQMQSTLGNAGSGSGSGPVYTTTSFSATPTFTVSTSTIQVFTITLTGNVTSSTLTTTSATNGQDITFNICQDGTGGRTFVWPTNVTGPSTIVGTASTCSRQTFRYDGTNAIAVTPLTCPACSSGISLTAVTAPGTPVAGVGEIYVDSTSKNIAVKDDAGVVKHGVQTVVCTNQFVRSINDAGAWTCASLASGDMPAFTGDVTNSGLALTIGAAKVAPTMMKASTFDAQSDGATITWAIASVLNAQGSVTLGGNRTLAITNPVVGGTYTLKITQDGTGSRTLALGSGCTWKVRGGGAGAITLTTAAGSIDVLTFMFDGTNCLATVGLNFN